MRCRHRADQFRLKVLSRRSGTVLVWFAMLLFVLLPLMTLIVHLGMVTLTRKQMQTAVNSAAVEGLRGRDELSETQRRERVRDLVSAEYDDNLNSDGGDALRLGAGPVIGFDDEPSDISLPGTDFKAARTIKSENIGVYDPDLSLNTADGRHGDMLSGQYVRDGRHQENNEYYRGDFLLPDDDASHPYSMYFPLDHGEYDSDIGDDAFLVRLRRTDNPDSLDNVSDVSSSEDTIPFLFGRGPYGGTDFLVRRERGTIVRATAIAQAQPAYRAGVRNEPSGLIGLLNIQMDIDLWLGVVEDEETITLIVGNDLSGQVQLISATETRLTRVTTVGEAPFVHTIGTPLLGTEGYVVLTDGTILNSEDDPIRRIVGFGLVTNAALTNGDTEISITRQLPQPVGLQNVSASVRPPESGDWSDINLSSLFSKIQAHSAEGRLILAPALVRTME
ncbi:hypothetical protein V6x_41470 [Gimesia chilikensis]|uniref:Putative Flp pilus-assembly TadG-like N-terminal domain-containing protein n=1 Tax=Gimesia chilikensis TaxID=2605989 RepID=A0A517WGN2_9PLAN|nr:TadE/TadG family type IV pilus assembly protein [Gimesia chilikensis]QDU04419.1 hypothetical protein V6x_41470 [Gimesia chilikensis]